MSSTPVYSFDASTMLACGHYRSKFGAPVLTRQGRGPVSLKKDMWLVVAKDVGIDVSSHESRDVIAEKLFDKLFEVYASAHTESRHYVEADAFYGKVRPGIADEEEEEEEEVEVPMVLPVRRGRVHQPAPGSHLGGVDRSVHQPMSHDGSSSSSRGQSPRGDFVPGHRNLHARDGYFRDTRPAGYDAGSSQRTVTEPRFGAGPSFARGGSLGSQGTQSTQSTRGTRRRPKDSLFSLENKLSSCTIRNDDEEASTLFHFAATHGIAVVDHEGIRFMKQRKDTFPSKSVNASITVREATKLLEKVLPCASVTYLTAYSYFLKNHPDVPEDIRLVMRNTHKRELDVLISDFYSDDRFARGGFCFIKWADIRHELQLD
jgi:hypothetical protein